jgi:hypothetical protein
VGAAFPSAARSTSVEIVSDPTLSGRTYRRRAPEQAQSRLLVNARLQSLRLREFGLGFILVAIFL